MSHRELAVSPAGSVAIMYKIETKNIRVRAAPRFMPSQSTPDENYYFWTYTIDITNAGNATVRLMTRHWRITDMGGRTEEVRGDGVIGEQPVLRPGDTFSYTSGCPLRTPSGIMVGSYRMQSEGGDEFDVAIPAFSLDSPFTQRRLN